MPKDKLAVAWQQAYSMENREAHGAAGRDIEYIGSTSRGNRTYDFYQDDQGEYWYHVRIWQGEKLCSEKEAIFGRKRRWRK